MKKTSRILKTTLAGTLSLLLCLFSFIGCVPKETKSLQSTSINAQGELIVTYSDGSQENLGKVVGETVTVPTESTPQDTVASAASNALRSAVHITCKFKASGYFSDTYASGGAGVIYRLDKDKGDALIITNYHVVYSLNCNTKNKVSNNISVFLYGFEYSSQAIKAEYVGGSLYYDIAVLRITDSDILKKSDAVAVTVANSNEAYVGDTAIAVGNPEGYGLSVSAGIISVDSEYISMMAVDERTKVTFRVMRIDTAVNAGNSGGGLFDETGRLIGIVNAKIIDNSVENIGYAIPSNIAIAVADNILYYCENSKLETPYCAQPGIKVATADSCAQYDEEKDRVVISEVVKVSSVTEGSPADGVLKKGDTIQAITVNGKTAKITREHHVNDCMLTVRAGDTVTFSILRNGTEMKQSITLTKDTLVAY